MPNKSSKKIKKPDNNQKLLTDFFLIQSEEYKIVYGFNSKTSHWHCLQCGSDMGDNPRQLCGKYYCIYEN